MSRSPGQVILWYKGTKGDDWRSVVVAWGFQGNLKRHSSGGASMRGRQLHFSNIKGSVREKFSLAMGYPHRPWKRVGYRACVDGYMCRRHPRAWIVGYWSIIRCCDSHYSIARRTCKSFALVNLIFIELFKKKIN